MIIAIVGTGNVGRALGTGFAAADHDIVFGSRNPDATDARDLVGGASDRVTVATPAEAVASGEVVVLAVPGSAVVSVASELADALDGKGVIDPTNTLDPGEASLAEQVAGAAPGARVVKAFNTIGAEGMRDPTFPDGAASMFVCGEEDAKSTALDLTVDLGFYPIDAGDLSAATYLENLGRFWIHLSRIHGRDVGFRLLGT